VKMYIYVNFRARVFREDYRSICNRQENFLHSWITDDSRYIPKKYLVFEAKRL